MTMAEKVIKKGVLCCARPPLPPFAALTTKAKIEYLQRNLHVDPEKRTAEVLNKL